ncbi:thermostable hemolysin [Kitasatospora kazusensis]|uniref:Thermostable hemolysin n=1 Tax=Kitasatospora kazusensis TaxID=407974 RepID=A0ABP5LM85_9ACTN
MLKISIARRRSAPWLAAADLVRKTYARTYEAQVMPDPDRFIVGQLEGNVIACAGLAPGTGGSFFSERYLDAPIDAVLEQRFGVPVDRDRVIEVGALASCCRGSGQEMIKITPVIAWTLGMEYILCTATAGLREALDSAGIDFAPLGDAEPDGLEPGERLAWGSYYEQKPQVGVISLRVLSTLFADATGKYAFLDPEVTLLADCLQHQEVAGRAGR